MKVHILLILCGTLASGYLAQAADENSSSNAVFKYRDQMNIRDLIVNVQDIEGSKRYLQNEYAKKEGLSARQAEALFGATGALDCGNGHGSGNLVVKNDILVTSAHILWDPDTCEPVEPAEGCVFMTIVDGKETQFAVKSLISTGFKCPDRHPAPNDDWAIFKLSKPAPKKIKPYVIGDALKMQKDDPVLAVNGGNADMFEKSTRTGKNRMAKTFAACNWGVPIDRVIATNCSATFGSSGSALLNSQREFVGLADNSTEDKDHLRAAITESINNHTPLKPSSCKYDPLSCATGYVPVQDDFKKALEATTSDDL